MSEQQTEFLHSPGPPQGPLVQAREIPFASFNNRYPQRACHIIGRGVTDFDYAALADVNESIFFINDAVCLERYAKTDSFFFAHDRQMLPWLDGSLRSTAVLPIDGKVFTGADPASLGHSAGVVYYHWREGRGAQLLKMSRDELAEAAALFTHSGTIHSLLHFVWYCGFNRVTLIGCDGLPRSADPTSTRRGGHDRRLENRSHSEAAWQYFMIREAQDAIIRILGLQVQYLGTPR